MNNGTKVLNPGTQVLIGEGGEAVVATVHPMGRAHMAQFAGNIAGVLRHVMSMKVDPNDKDMQAAVVMQLLPIVLADLMDLVGACTTFDHEGLTIDDLPHYMLPELAETWIVESFGEERKWRPWVTVVERLTKRFTGKELNLAGMMKKANVSHA